MDKNRLAPYFFTLPFKMTDKKKLSSVASEPEYDGMV